MAVAVTFDGGSQPSEPESDNNHSDSRCLSSYRPCIVMMNTIIVILPLTVRALFMVHSREMVCCEFPIFREALIQPNSLPNNNTMTGVLSSGS